MVDCLGQQLGLTPIPRVDRPSGDTGSTSNLRHTSAGIAAVSEFCGGGEQQARAKGVLVDTASVYCNLQDGV